MMRAFIVNISQLFRLDTQKGEDANFAVDKRKLLIPLYQREYKWTDEKIQSLVNDIERRDKFLGNVILDEVNDCYEIVDGQQRITTCYLLLLSLFNYYKGHQREQESIKNFIKPYNDKFVLQNDSVGNFVTDDNGILKISISERNDVYYQRDDFERAFNTINDFVYGLRDQKTVHEIKQKLLDCQLLVLINTQHSYTRQVEQIFLDINEKAQLLEVEDIFKGHCFENYDEGSHKDLRNTWIQLKKYGMGFKKFGYEHLSQYIYLYLLEHGNPNMPATLTLEGKHYLDGKSTDETEKLLLGMIEYGESVIEFYSKINQNDYRFDDICENSYEYRNTGDHKLLKIMCKEMLENTKAQYQKFPLMHFIYYLKTKEGANSAIKHLVFRKIITNLYIYMSLFILSGGKKSKKDVDHTFYKALDGTTLSMTDAVEAARMLRKDKVEAFKFKINYKYEDLSFIYSIIDYYSANDNWLKFKYTKEEGYNLEHFIIPDNARTKISWTTPEKTYNYFLPATLSSQYKKNTLNYLVLNKDLNESIENKDIVTKIEVIKEWYESPNKVLPNHIMVIISYIESLAEYQELKKLKEVQVEKEKIEETYENFIRSYFFEDNQQKLFEILRSEFIRAFSNA